MQKLHLFLLLSIGLLVYLVLDSLYGHYTYDVSIQIIHYIATQDSIVYETLESILLLFSALGDRGITNMIIVILWNQSGRKEQVLKVISVYCICTYLGDFIKLILIEPRPFYIDETINLTICYTGFGGPSGHTLRTLVFYVLLFDTVIFKKYKQNADGFETIGAMNRELLGQDKQISNQLQYDNLYPNAMLSYNASKFLLGCFIVAAASSRVYLGIHFINQLITGWIIGGYILAVYFYCNGEQIIEQFYQEAIYKSIVIPQQRLRRLVILIGSFLCINILTITLYYQRHLSNDVQTLEQGWLININKQPSCHGGLKYFEDYDIIKTTIVNLPLFLYICCQYCFGHYKPQDYPKSDCSIKCLIRLILLMILLMVPNFVRQVMKSMSTNVLISYFLVGQLYYWALAFSWIMVVPIVYKWTSMDWNGDLFRRVTQVEQQEMEL